MENTGRDPSAVAWEAARRAAVGVKAVDRAWTGLYAMMDPCHLLWRGIDLETQARPHAHMRPRADHPSRRGHLPNAISRQQPPSK